MKLVALSTAFLVALLPLVAQAQTAPLDVQEVRTDAFPRMVVRLRESPDTTSALSPNQLQVLENGQVQPSADVRQLRNPAVPTSIALAIDVSGSMSDQGKLTAAQAAAKAFTEQIRPIDKVVVVGFADEVTVPQPLTADHQLLGRTIDQLEAGGNTSLYDAVAQGLTQLSISPSGSRALVVLTDGNDTASQRQLSDDVAQAVQLTVPIYAIGLGSDADTKVLERFASDTGGHYYSAPTGKDLTDAFRQISHQLGAEYQVTWISNSPASANTDVQINLAHADGSQTSATLSYQTPTFATHTASADPVQAFIEVHPISAPTEQQVLLAGLAAGMGTFLLAFGVVYRRNQRRTQARLTNFVSGRPAESIAFTLRRSQLSPVTATAATMTGRLLPRKLITYLRFRMVQAGYPSERHLGIFLAAEAALAAIIGALAYLLIQSTGFMAHSPISVLGLTTFGVVFGGYLPYMWLRRKINSRQKAMMKALPDALDLMVISVTAGLSLDTALSEVVLKWDGELSREFNLVLNEMRMGVSRRDALNSFARRAQLQDIQLLVAALLQADEIGSEVSEVLSTQADQLRVRRHHLAEETARKAPIKMLFPMVLLIFPAMFSIILAPAFIQIMGVFGGLQHG